jgi:hypothetical protein
MAEVLRSESAARYAIGMTEKPAAPVSVTRYSERFTKCASCRSDARWMVNGTTTCDRHRELWIRRAGGAR